MYRNYRTNLFSPSYRTNRIIFDESISIQNRSFTFAERELRRRRGELRRRRGELLAVEESSVATDIPNRRGRRKASYPPRESSLATNTPGDERRASVARGPSPSRRTTILIVDAEPPRETSPTITEPPRRNRFAFRRERGFERERERDKTKFGFVSRVTETLPSHFLTRAHKQRGFTGLIKRRVFPFSIFFFYF